MCTSEVCDHVPLCCSSLSGMDYSCHSFSGEKGARERERGKGGLLASASTGSSDWRTGVVGGRGAVTDVDGCVGYVEEGGGGVGGSQI